jgi:hypothetical protein
MTGVGAQAEKVRSTLTVVPGDGSDHEGGKKDDSPSLIDEVVLEGARRC